jgi:hypothetical protein
LPRVIAMLVCFGVIVIALFIQGWDAHFTPAARTETLARLDADAMVNVDGHEIRVNGRIPAGSDHDTVIRDCDEDDSELVHVGPTTEGNALLIEIGTRRFCVSVNHGITYEHLHVRVVEIGLKTDEHPAPVDALSITRALGNYDVLKDQALPLALTLAAGVIGGIVVGAVRSGGAVSPRADSA